MEIKGAFGYWKGKTEGSVLLEIRYPPGYEDEMGDVEATPEEVALVVPSSEAAHPLDGVWKTSWRSPRWCVTGLSSKFAATVSGGRVVRI